MPMSFERRPRDAWNLVSFPVGPLACNCSILWEPQTKEALIVDPGGDAARILKVVTDEKLNVRAVLHTHAHFDHVGATHEVFEATKAALYLHEGDLFLWDNLSMQGKMFGFPVKPIAEKPRSLADEMTFSVGTKNLRSLHTPGHTPGSFSFVLDDILFAGDTLFKGSVGRTDLWGGDFDQLSKGIKSRLYTLDDDTIVICGHGPNTSIGQEKKSNPFVRV